MITAGIYDWRNGVHGSVCTAPILSHVRFGSKADVHRRPTNVRFTPESGNGDVLTRGSLRLSNFFFGPLEDFKAAQKGAKRRTRSIFPATPWAFDDVLALT
jgi:hypothetical protein